MTVEGRPLGVIQGNARYAYTCVPSVNSWPRPYKGGIALNTPDFFTLKFVSRPTARC